MFQTNDLQVNRNIFKIEFLGIESTNFPPNMNTIPLIQLISLIPTRPKILDFSWNKTIPTPNDNQNNFYTPNSIRCNNKISSTLSQYPRFLYAKLLPSSETQYKREGRGQKRAAVSILADYCRKIQSEAYPMKRRRPCHERIPRISTMELGPRYNRDNVILGETFPVFEFQTSDSPSQSDKR